MSTEVEHVKEIAIEEFRGLKSLTVPEFGNVTLFVGRNGVGKTSLLEALYCGVLGDTRSMAELLVYRHVFPANLPDRRLLAAYVKRFLEPIVSQLTRIYLGPGNQRLAWIGNSPPGPVAAAVSHDVPDALISLRSQPSAMLIPASGIPSRWLSQMWERVALTDQEDEVVRMLQILDPRIDRLSMFTVGELGNERYMAARLRGIPQPLSLNELGHGMERLLGLVLAMVTTKGGVLLIDEIESGLHYSLLDEIWTALFKMALLLNVQIIATTHSWDAILAFQAAANASESEGLLYRLESNGSSGHMRAIAYTEAELAVAAEHHIEVR